MEGRKIKKRMVEIVWHARGGQGAKTAAQMAAHVALAEGKFAQGFPEYGPERMGAPTRGYTRISEGEIRVHCAITAPDVVVVLDETLVGNVPMTEGVTEETIFIVNSRKSPKEIKEALGVKKNRVYVIDATGIAIDELGRSIPNVPMMGALVRATGILGLDGFKEDVRKKFGKKFGEKIVAGNIRALERAYTEVKEG
ncbi:MAG: 2-oxoacid:acceptor oxidoreductase family protein [Planctomycetota bacterium]|nr:2-oxoacid:acceptor oxidoreductase family protein [Planctomycetota bacterium]